MPKKTLCKVKKKHPSRVLNPFPFPPPPKKKKTVSVASWRSKNINLPTNLGVGVKRPPESTIPGCVPFLLKIWATGSSTCLIWFSKIYQVTLGTGGYRGSTWVGWGDDHVPWTCRHGWCYARSWGWGGVGWWSRSLNLPTWLMLRKKLGVGWGGVGWWSRSLNLPTWLMLRKKLGVGWGGVMITFLELADMVDATQEVRGGVGWGDDHVPWTCRHGWCYARSWGWGGVGWWSRSLNLPTWLMLRKKLGVGWGGVGWGDDHVPWTCRHGWCYARSWGWGGVGWWSRSLKCMSGLVSPTDAFKKPLWQFWLTGSKKKRLTVMLLGPQIHCK